MPVSASTTPVTTPHHGRRGRPALPESLSTPTLSNGTAAATLPGIGALQIGLLSVSGAIFLLVTDKHTIISFIQVSNLLLLPLR